MAIVLSILPRYTFSDYPFDIFKLFPMVGIKQITLNIFLLNITNWDRTQVFPTYEVFSRFNNLRYVLAPAQMK